jgi:hypothetical protein
MCDYFDDFDNHNFLEDDSFEDGLEGEMNDPFAGDSEPDENPDEAESKDGFTATHAFLAGSFAAWAYEEGFEEGHRKKVLKEQSKRRKRKRFSDDSN